MFTVGDIVIRISHDYASVRVDDSCEIANTRSRGVRQELQLIGHGNVWFDSEYFILASSVASAPTGAMAIAAAAGAALNTTISLETWDLLNATSVKLPKIHDCDCGGLKTYGLVSRETCSQWCSSQSKA